MTATSNSWINQWQERVAPDESHKLQRRIGWDGQDVNSFQSWLNSEPTAVDDAAAHWHETLTTACRCLEGGWNLPLLPLEAGKQRPFVDLWWPLHGWAITQLKNECSYSDTVLQQLAERDTKNASRANVSRVDSRATPPQSAKANERATENGNSASAAATKAKNEAHTAKVAVETIGAAAQDGATTVKLGDQLQHQKQPHQALQPA